MAMKETMVCNMELACDVYAHMLFICTTGDLLSVVDHSKSVASTNARSMVEGNPLSSSQLCLKQSSDSVTGRNKTSSTSSAHQRSSQDQPSQDLQAYCKLELTRMMADVNCLLAEVRTNSHSVTCASNTCICALKVS